MAVTRFDTMPNTAAPSASVLLAGHGADLDGPLFQPLRSNGKRQEERRPMDPDAIDCVVRKFAAGLGLDRGYSAHSMRATVITTVVGSKPFLRREHI